MSAIQDLLATMARLRRPGGCPWDQEQTHRSLAQTLIEETAELLETIDHEDFDHMQEELGDVLLQVVFHAQMAQEAGHFDFDSVARGINDKLIRRHPHVFGDSAAADSEDVLVQWEAIKAQERAAQPPRMKGDFKELPPALPALLYARDVIKQARKLDKPLPLPNGHQRDQTLTEESAGKQLFELAAACQSAKVDPESALRRYTNAYLATHATTPAS